MFTNEIFNMIEKKYIHIPLYCSVAAENNGISIWKIMTHFGISIWKNDTFRDLDLEK